MESKLIYYQKKILVLFLFIFSIVINYYYGNKGIFPQDSFLHFDSAYRILNGDSPFEDYWTVSAPLEDYIQV